MENVVLTNGQTIALSRMRSVVAAAEAMRGSSIEVQVVAVSEIISLAHNPHHEVEPKYRKELKRLGMMQDDGTLTEDVANVLMCAYADNGLEVKRLNPVQDNGDGGI